LRIDRIKEIHARIPDTHLVMHGSSSVPQDWLEIINNQILSALPAEPKASKRAAQISLIALVASFKNLRGSK
jgi:hypothetical protein